MNKTVVSAVLGIIGGAGIGAGVTYILFKKHFDAELNEEAEGLKEYYANYYKTYYKDVCINKKEDKPDNSDVKTPMSHMGSASPDPVEQDSIFDSYIETSATNYSTSSVAPEKPKGLDEENDISIIDENEYYGAIADGAEPTAYMYYADHVLADENSDVIENVDDLVGSEALSHFGIEGVDSVYVHNKRLKMYIEILRSERLYKEDYAYKL